jgi:hypothetical protein
VKIHIADHPLITHKLTVLRDEKTDSPTFRRLTEEIVTLLAYEAMREVKTQAVTVKTPVAMAQGAQLTKPKPVVVKPTVKRTYKPRVKKAVTKVNLSDRLTKMVPTAGVAYQPEFEPLVNVPVYFWCDLPSLFQSRVDIIGEVVDVALRPSFVWSFGDGSVLATTENGAPYPNGQIHHTYSKPGNYLVTLLTTWNGTYTHNAQARAVSGTVKKLTVAAITIVQAPTHFKG